MKRDTPPDKQKVSPAEIWDGLTPEQRRPVIRLLVQMALEVFQSQRIVEEGNSRSDNTRQRSGGCDESVDRSE